MTFNERVHAVSEFGFTTRQARFLVSVMLHGGVCLPRQYARLAGTAYGHKVNVFFDKLVSLRYAVRCRCVHNRAAVYHVRHQPLYRAISEPHSRNRKPVPASRVGTFADYEPAVRSSLSLYGGAIVGMLTARLMTGSRPGRLLLSITAFFGALIGVVAAALLADRGSLLGLVLVLGGGLSALIAAGTALLTPRGRV